MTAELYNKAHKMLTAYKCVFFCFQFFLLLCAYFCHRLELHLKAIFVITLQFIIIILRIFKVFSQTSLMRIL